MALSNNKTQEVDAAAVARVVTRALEPNHGAQPARSRSQFATDEASRRSL